MTSNANISIVLPAHPLHILLHPIGVNGKKLEGGVRLLELLLGC